jgi:transposase-like protein
MQSIDELFKGRHFEREIIILCVRWYLRFKLSFRDLVEMMAERGIDLAHTTIMRWIQRYVPEFEKRWNRFACKAGGSWRVDETYVKIKGCWTYLYRAVDSNGQTVDFLLRAKRDVAAAKAFFRRAFESQRSLPRAITLDGYQASHRAAREFLATHRRGYRTKIRSSKYLNNLIEQDHRSIKLRLGPMLGFKRFRNASITIAGIELVHRIRKGQFALKRLRVRGKTAPEIWTAVLAA